MMVLFAASLLVDLWNRPFHLQYDDIYLDLEVPEDCFWVAASTPPGYREGTEDEWIIEDLLMVQPPPVQTDKSFDLATGYLSPAEVLRSEQGVRRYGTTLHSFNGRDALADAFQEAVDGMMYCRQKMMENEANPQGSYYEAQCTRRAFGHFRDATIELLRAARLRKQREAQRYANTLN